MRRVVVLMALLVGACACGSSAASTTAHRIVFGIGGGNMVPWQVTIEPTGGVRTNGIRVGNKHLSKATVRRLDNDVRAAFGAGMKTRLCKGTLPDFGSHIVRAYGRRVVVRGTCEPRFTKLWNQLLGAVEFRLGASRS